MRFRYDPESRLQERVGHVAVTVLLVVAFLATAGCQDSSGDEGTPAETEARADRGTGHVAVRPTDTPPAATEPTTPTTPEPARPSVVSFEEAEARFRDKQYGESVALFTAYTERKPENPWGHYMLGLAAWKNGELARAEVALRRTLELDPNHVKSYVNLGRVLLALDRADEARDAATEAVDIDPVSNDGYRVLGLAYSDLGQRDSAAAAYRDAILLDGTDAWSMNNLGLLHILNGRFEEALGPLIRAVELRDDVATFHNNLGIALERTGYLADATEEFESAIALDPDHAKAATSLTRVRELGDAGTRVNRVQLAQGFVEEIERWRNPVVTSEDSGAQPPPLESEVARIEIQTVDTTKAVGTSPSSGPTATSPVVLDSVAIGVPNTLR